MNKNKCRLNILNPKNRNNNSKNVEQTTEQVVAKEEFKLPQVDSRGFASRKSVYISKEIHHKISQIAYVLANRTITVGGLVDAILNEYIQQNGEGISELYRKHVDRNQLW